MVTLRYLINECRYLIVKVELNFLLEIGLIRYFPIFGNVIYRKNTDRKNLKIETIDRPNDKIPKKISNVIFVKNFNFWGKKDKNGRNIASRYYKILKIFACGAENGRNHVAGSPKILKIFACGAEKGRFLAYYSLDQ